MLEREKANEKIWNGKIKTQNGKSKKKQGK